MYLSQNTKCICLKILNVFVSNYKMHLSQNLKCICLQILNVLVSKYKIYFLKIQHDILYLSQIWKCVPKLTIYHCPSHKAGKGFDATLAHISWYRCTWPCDTSRIELEWLAWSFEGKGGREVTSSCYTKTSNCLFEPWDQVGCNTRAAVDNWGLFHEAAPFVGLLPSDVNISGLPRCCHPCDTNTRVGGPF